MTREDIVRDFEEYIKQCVVEYDESVEDVLYDLELMNRYPDVLYSKLRKLT